LGQVLYERNELDAAEGHLTQAVELGELMADWSMMRRGLLPLAWLRQMQGDTPAAQALWQRALDVVQQAESKRVEAQLMTHQARLCLARAAVSPADRPALDTAAGWAETYRRSELDPRSYPQVLPMITLAWVELAHGRPDRALEPLEPLAVSADAGGWIDNLIKIMTIKAQAQAALGDPGSALDTLSRALDLAEPEGYVRTFVDYGPPVQRLLERAVARGIEPDYAAKLLAAFGAEEHQGASPPQPASPPAPQPLIERLTERETAILRLMAAGLSHREIAEELYLSVNTVKWYSTHIYSKLGVHRRANAVARAQELGIL
jgi:LuxR family maltose regulon positive regulatory protein